MVAFDTLRAAQRLRDEADQPPATAETIAAVIGEAVAPGRDDVAALREDMSDMRADMGALRGEVREGLQALRADVYAALFRLAGFVVAVAVAVATIAVAVAKLT